MHFSENHLIRLLKRLKIQTYWWAFLYVLTVFKKARHTAFCFWNCFIRFWYCFLLRLLIVRAVFNISLRCV